MSPNASSVRARLREQGLDEPQLHAFRVGYAPTGWEELIEALASASFGAAELAAACVATISERAGVHAQFRSRIMFPLAGDDGRIEGFAGMATNPGPSWPLWTGTPESDRFSRASAIFGLDRAREPIAARGRVIVLGDCLDVIRMHSAGTTESVAVIRSGIRPGHLARLGAALGGTIEQVVPSGDDIGDEPSLRDVFELGPASSARLLDEPGPTEPERRKHRGLIPHPSVERPPAARVAVNVARVLLGAGIPLGWLQVVGFELDSRQATEPAFVGAIGCVAATYAVLALLSAFASGGVRARWTGRRMRLPWEYGAGEWQPPAWTYHAFEDIMVGAAMVSVFVCLGMFFTIGGFIE